MSLLDTTYPKPVTPWQCAGHVPLPQTVAGRINLLEEKTSHRHNTGPHKNTAEKVYAKLLDGPATVAKMKTELRMPHATLRNALNRLIDAGRVEVCGIRNGGHERHARVYRVTGETC